jgi:hypothetical protein
MAGENCVISVPNFGSIKLVVIRLVFGLNIFTFGAGGEIESRTAKQFHTSHRTSGSFDITMVFNSWPRYDEAMKWFERYIQWAADPNTDASPARVVVPSRRFDRTAVLEGGLTFGDQAGKVVYLVELSFKGARDPVTNIKSSDLLAKFVPAEESELVRLLPASYGRSGRNSWDAVGGLVDDVDDFGGGGGRALRPI